MPRVRQVIATKSIHPRSMDPENLKVLAHRFGRPAMVIDEISEAMEEAIEITGDQEMILVTGSLFVAGGALHSWYNRNQE
jgi:folylpolyglutamate synthase/dihydropteroate synthase